MQVALIAPLISPLIAGQAPLGGAQSFLLDLARGLADRGQTVTLLAASGSVLDGVARPELGIAADRLRPARFVLSEARLDTDEQVRAFSRVRAWLDQHLEQVQVIHAHAYDAPAFVALRGLTRPVLHTLHLPPLDPEVVAAARQAAAEPDGRTALITVSRANAAAWQAVGAPVRAIIPNGVDLDAIPFRARSDGYLLFAGRIAPEKGPDLAIRAAAAVGRPLLLVGGAYDERFFASAVRPLVRCAPDWRPGEPLALGATYVGPRPRPELLELMGRAAALLLPVRWDEPYGLVAAEAQAAGCPVVAFARGGLLEVVDDGRSGCLVPPADETAFSAAVDRASALDRAACRSWIAAHYSLERMLERYERLYEEVCAAA